MPIVGGLDIHRKQITFDYPGTVIGQVQRGQISPADREHLRAWLARFAGCGDAAFAVEGCTGWRYVAGELAAAGIAPHLAQPADTAFARGRKRHAKTDRTDSRHLRLLLAEGCRSAGSRPAASWRPGPCPGCITTCGPGTPPGCSGSTRCCSTTAPPALGPGTLRTRQGAAALQAVAASGLSPAGQLQVATALEVIEALETRMHAVRHQLLAAARHLTGAKVLAARLYGVGPVTALAMTCWLAGAGRFSSSRQAVRFAGLDVTVWSSDRKGPPGRLSRQGPPVLRWAVYGRQDPRPVLRPGLPVLRPGQGPLQRQARRAVRGPQDPPPGPSHPGRARRRRADRRLRPLAPGHGDQRRDRRPGRTA